MRTRDHNWFDTNNNAPLYSYQVYKDGKWHHPLKEGKVQLFATKEERDAARAEARKVRYEL